MLIFFNLKKAKASFSTAFYDEYGALRSSKIKQIPAHPHILYRNLGHEKANLDSGEHGILNQTRTERARQTTEL